MNPVTDDRLTVADYRATPPGPPWYQLVEGDLVVAPSPSRFHQEILGNLHLLLASYVTQQNLGKVFIAPFDVYLTEHNIFQPDLLFVSNARAHILADDGVHGAPDLVIEIISPSNAQLDKNRKRRVYAQEGVREFWLVDPHLLQVHRYDFATDRAKPVRIIDEDESFETPLLPGLGIVVSAIFKR